MKINFLKQFVVVAILLFSFSINAQDNNFHIYLCFGQSNMEGAAKIESDYTEVNERFRVMATTDCDESGREMGKWYVATPPLARCYAGMGVADFFGRKMVEQLPSNIEVGVVNVSVGGCKIELFDKDNYQNFAATAPDWMEGILKQYGNNPYARLVEIAKLAQLDGVIKGILLHQGESDTGDTSWPARVNKVYTNLLKDLNLNASEVPLLVGGVVAEDQHGTCASMNEIIRKVPETIPTSHFIPSDSCTAAADSIHFNIQGYKELGNRYATKMLSILK